MIQCGSCKRWFEELADFGRCAKCSLRRLAQRLPQRGGRGVMMHSGVAYGRNCPTRLIGRK